VLERGRSATGGAVDAATRQALGEVMGEVDFAYAGVREIARMTDEVIFAAEGFTPVHEARMTAANAVAAMTLRRVIHVCMELVSSNYIFDRHPMQRVIRDSIGALAHSGTRRSHLIGLADTALAEARDAGERAVGFTIADDPFDWQRYLSTSR
jgi:indole-3-acetate monooxygenase